MAKGNKSRRGKKRQTKRMVRRRRSLGISNQPPPLHFNQQMMNTVLRYSVSKIANNDELLVLDFTTDNLFSSYPQLRICFREVKIIRSKLWIMPQLSSTAPGLYTFCVAPKDQVNPSETFNGLSSTPGCITRKVSQTAKAVYYPTEPSEKDWFPVGSGRHLFVGQVFATGLVKSNGINVNGNLPLQVVCDTHLRFRGRASNKTSYAEYEVVSAMDAMN